MDLRADLLQTLREFITRDNRVISEDIEPEVIACIDVDPIRSTMRHGDITARKFGVALIGFEVAGTRGMIDPADLREFDGGLEFMERNDDFWELPTEELLKYRMDFTPRSMEDIPQRLPDYLGLEFEAGGLKDVWGDVKPDDIEDNSDEMQNLMQLLSAVEDEMYNTDDPPVGARLGELEEYQRLLKQKISQFGGLTEGVDDFEFVDDEDLAAAADAAADVEADQSGTVTVYDAESKKWINVPEDEIPVRPAGSGGYLKLQRVVTNKGGKPRFSYRPYRRSLDLKDENGQRIFSDHKIDSEFDTVFQLKTPWMMFVDWFFVALENIRMPPQWNGCAPDDQVCRSLSVSRKRVDVVSDAVTTSPYMLSLVGEIEQKRRLVNSLRTKMKDARDAGFGASLYANQLATEQSELTKLNDKLYLVRRYGLLGISRNERNKRDFSQPPLKDGRHPKMYPTKWSDEVDRINTQPMKHVLGPEDEKYYKKRAAFLDGLLDTAAMFDTGKQTIETDALLMRARAADLRNQRARQRQGLFGRSGESRAGMSDEVRKAAKLQRLAKLREKRAAAAADRSKRWRTDLLNKRKLGESAGDFSLDGLDLSGKKSSKSSKSSKKSAIGYETHCPGCTFPASEYGHDKLYGKTRRKGKGLIDDDAYDMILRFPNLTSEPPRSGAKNVMISAARNLLALLKQVGIPDWLDAYVDDRVWTDEDEESQEGLLGKPKSGTYGRIFFVTKVRQPGLVPGLPKTKMDPRKLDPFDPDFDEKRAEMEKHLLKARKGRTAVDVSRDPSGLGHIMLPDAEIDPEGTIRLGTQHKVVDARKLASADQATRDRAYRQLKRAVRDHFTSGSMGAAKQAGITRGQQAVRAAKTERTQEEKASLFIKLIDDIQKSTNSWIKIHGQSFSFMEGEVLEALSRYFQKIGANLDPQNITPEAVAALSKNIRDRVQAFLDNAAANPAYYLGDLTESIRRRNIALRDGRDVSAAYLMIEESLDNIITGEDDLENDIAMLLKYRDTTNAMRAMVKEDPDLYAATLALSGYSPSAAIRMADSYLTEDEVAEIAALREGVASESVKPLVTKASLILNSDSYNTTLKIFQRVVEQLSLDDLYYLPIIAPQKIINDGRLENAPLEAVLNDIGHTYNTLVANSTIGTSTNIWTKLGNLQLR